MISPQKKRISLADLADIKKTLRQGGLNTVCESARCPNIGECFSHRVATLLIAGTVCTRGCRFCAISAGKPAQLDPAEPGRVADLIAGLGLKYAVITSVTRDDLPDGGAAHFAATIKELRGRVPELTIEVLVPDFAGNTDAAATVFAANPDVFSHNIETVPSLYRTARAGSDYQRSLGLLRQAANSGMTVKSGIMLGLGETLPEVRQTMRDIRETGCSILTLGQYLAPTAAHLPVAEHIAPAVFDQLKAEARALGFNSCASGTYVRSSYRADTMLTQDR